MSQAACIRLQRFSLVSAVVLAVLAGILNVTMMSWIPEAARPGFVGLLRARPPHDVLVLAASLFGWSILALGLVGLWRHRAWGLWCASAATLASIAAAVPLGPHVYSGGAYAVACASKILWGIGLGTSIVLVGPGCESVRSRRHQRQQVPRSGVEATDRAATQTQPAPSPPPSTIA